MPFGHHHRIRENSEMNADDIASFLGLEKDWKIIDIGGGDGYYSKGFLKFTSNVFLLDIENWAGEDFNKYNIKFIKSNFCNFKTEEKFDVGFMANVYHDFRIECKEKTLSNLKEIITKRIGILDFIPGKAFFGPPFKVREEEVISDMESIGFNLSKKKYLTYHYYLVFDRKNE